MTRRYGIDLGTTYSLISRYDESRQEVRPIPLETEDGETASLPSVVLYPAAGEPVVGSVAWNTRKQDPDRTVVGVKRKMGEDWQSEEMDGRRFTPQQVSSEVLRVLKDNAEIEMGEEVTDVVITVPAYFGERQCAATLEAATLAGLNVLNILSEPHAAAVAYSVERAVDLSGRHVLVYDLGGGTFDVTLIKPVLPGSDGDPDRKIVLDTLCKDGNRELGGLDWDDALVDLVAERCQADFEFDPRNDPRSAALLHENCERAKRALSKKNEETVVADMSGHVVTVTREDFESATSSLLLQTRMRLEQVLAEALAKHGLTLDDIDILVCGGATRMPMVKAMIEEVAGRAPLEHKNPQLLVANGAAYVAHAMDPEATIPLPGKGGEASAEAEEVRIAPDSITDITCHAVGMQVIRHGADGKPRPVNAVVLQRGTAFGERHEVVTQTLFDGQSEVCIRLFEGDDPDPDECQHLMDFRIEGLPSDRPAGCPIRTTLWFGSNGVILGTALDCETNREIEIHYDRWGRAAENESPQPTPAATAAPPEPLAEAPPMRLTSDGAKPAPPSYESTPDPTPTTAEAGPFDPAAPFSADGENDPAFTPATETPATDAAAGQDESPAAPTDTPASGDEQPAPETQAFDPVPMAPIPTTDPAGQDDDTGRQPPPLKLT
jgi:molecular chaperone DnaK